MDNSIKVGICLAYDWEYLYNSLPLIYPYSDKICLSLDKDRISWGGSKYDFNDKAFYQFVHDFDKGNKIIIYEDDFHLPAIKPMENEVRQRNKIAEKLGAGGWHIQLDTDEYFVDFKGFTEYLRNFKSERKVNIVCPWYTMFKETDNGFLYVGFDELEKVEFIPIATRVPNYEYGRSNGYFNIKTNFYILHQSWARSESQILEKINNWGHKGDFDAQKYFERWKTLNESNYKEFVDFHPAIPEVWRKLDYREGKEIISLVKSIKNNPPYELSQKTLDKQNSLWRSRWKSLLSRLKIK